MRTAPGNAAALFGRADEVARLTGHIDACLTTGGPRAFVIVGDPGIGKTRLAREAARLTELSPVRRLTGFEPEQFVSLGAASGLLAELAGEPGESARRLARLLRSDQADRDGLASIRLFAAAGAVLLSTSPSLLVVDDLQWLDEVSRALLHHVVRSAVADNAPLALVCATRPAPEAVAWAQSLRTLFGDSDRYVDIDLAPLGADAGASLALARNPMLTPETAEKVWAGAGGSPFWIGLQAGSGGHDDEPRRVLARLLHMLSDDAGRCLAAMVVFARPMPDEILPDVLGWPEPRTVAAVGELVTRGVVTKQPGLVATAHDLVREAALATVPGAEQARLHARICDYLRRTADGDLQLMMSATEHAVAAGIDASGLAVAVASSPQRRLVGTDGVHRLAGLADSVVDDEERIRLTALVAQLAEELGERQVALSRLSWLATVLPTPQERAAAAIRAARQAFDIGDSAQTADLLAQARRDGSDDEWALVAADALDSGRLVWLDHDATSAVTCRERALTTARRLVAPAGGLDRLDARQRTAYVAALDAERVGRLMADDMDGLLVVSHELIDATRGLGERHLEARAFISMALRFFNKWPEVADRMAGIVTEAEQQVYPSIAAYAAYEHALATYNTGYVGTARELHAKAARMGAHLDDLRHETTDTWLCGLGPLIDASAVDWRAGVAALVRETSVQTNQHCRLLLHQRAAMLAARFDPHDSRDFVLDELAKANADAAQAQCVRCCAEVEIVTAELMARVGETGPAAELLAQWDARHPAPKPRTQLFRDRATALIAARCGQPNAAELLERLATAAQNDGLRLEQLWALLDLAEVLTDTDLAATKRALTEAATLATELGAASERGLADRRLRAIGARTRPAPRPRDSDPPLAGLSRREHEVARLAARGVRNAEIASSLFLSPKTVEQHLSRVFAKLGVRNRGELAAQYADRLG